MDALGWLCKIARSKAYKKEQKNIGIFKRLFLLKIVKKINTTKHPFVYYLNFEKKKT